MQEKTFDTGTIVLNYAESEAGGPPLVVLHGLTGRWQGMQALLPRLLPAWHVFAVDLRGHGRSGRVPDCYRLSDYVQDIAAFVGRFDEPVTLLGHSLGALTALGTAACLPERVRRLVLLDPPLYGKYLSITETPGIMQWFGWVYAAVQSAESPEALAAQYRAIDPAADEAMVRARTEELFGLAPDTVRIGLEDRLFEGYDLEQALRQIACPTLLVHGDWASGSVVRVEDAALVQAHLAGVQIVQIPNGTHMFAWEQPEATWPAVGAFLEG